MLSPDLPPEEFRAYWERYTRPFMEDLQIDCLDCETLVKGLLAGEVKTAVVCRHIHGCEISQARLQQAAAMLTAIPVEIPVVLEWVEA